MKVTSSEVGVGGLDGLNALIHQKALRKLNSGEPGCTDYFAAVRAVAIEEPALFLTRARLELDAKYRNQTIFFEKSASGQLINPAVLQDGVLVPIPAPIDTAPVIPYLNADQEMAMRVADKMNRMAASSGAHLSYAEVFKMVASECPNLMARRGRSARGGVDNYR